ncbi:MAG TPA: hypothetical protein VFK38_07210, partial [Candidatus Limnocylindrales bacterium]|nr:hypothetical protein [Candidatus Limnocylindrales bacterium]
MDDAPERPAPDAGGARPADPDHVTEGAEPTAGVTQASAAEPTGEHAPSRLDDDGEGDMAFAENVDPTLHEYGLPKPPERVCQWCNQPLPDPEAAVCPHCGSRLKPVEEELDVPGLTSVARSAIEAQERIERKRREAAGERAARVLGGAPLAPASSLPPVVLPPAIEGDPSFQPPDPEVERLMRQMELEARLAERGATAPRVAGEERPAEAVGPPPS